MTTKHCFLALLLAAASCRGASDKPAAGVADTLQAAVSAQADTASQEPAESILHRTVYTRTDSLCIAGMLSDTVKGNDVLHYARKFIGRPYVAATLEVADPEQLVVNTRELDCTTLVETALALAMTHRQGARSFEAYCRNLERLRYRDGRMDGYLSRLHYFTWWMHDNIRKGIIREVRDDLHFTAPIRVDNHYMSRHADKYPLLVKHPEWVDSIRSMERGMNGPDGTYLPEASTGLMHRQLRCIASGDLVAIVTRKDGIDYSHLGIAVWGTDGRLHLLNASSIRHQVVEEPKTLRKYLSEHPSSIGIRVFRLEH